jgi:hypothetical protein
MWNSKWREIVAHAARILGLYTPPMPPPDNFDPDHF